jgi:hypothetical protein
LAENLLVDTNADIEGVKREHRENQRNPVEKGCLGDGRGLAGACSSCYKAHVSCLFQVQALSLLAATNMHFGSCSSGLQGAGKVGGARWKGKSFFGDPRIENIYLPRGAAGTLFFVNANLRER